MAKFHGILCHGNSAHAELEILEAVSVRSCGRYPGPRHAGKARSPSVCPPAKAKDVHYFDLEDPMDMERLAQPLLTLEASPAWRCWTKSRGPELFPSSGCWRTGGGISVSFCWQRLACPGQAFHGKPGRPHLIFRTGGFGLEHLEKKRISRLWPEGLPPFLPGAEHTSPIMAA